MKQIRKRPVEDIRNLELKLVPWLPGYYINTDGRVFSVMELTPYEDQDGYMRVHVFKEKKHKRPGVHSLMARTFLSEPKPGQDQVRHLDGNRKHNAIDNLAWGTVQENGADKARHGSARGSKNGRAILTESKVQDIKARLLGGEKASVLADEFCVSDSTIYAIKSGKNWGC